MVHELQLIYSFIFCIKLTVFQMDFNLPQNTNDNKENPKKKWMLNTPLTDQTKSYKWYIKNNLLGGKIFLYSHSVLLSLEDSMVLELVSVKSWADGAANQGPDLFILFD